VTTYVPTPWAVRLPIPDAVYARGERVQTVGYPALPFRGERLSAFPLKSAPWVPVATVDPAMWIVEDLRFGTESIFVARGGIPATTLTDALAVRLLCPPVPPGIAIVLVLLCFVPHAARDTAFHLHGVALGGGERG